MTRASRREPQSSKQATSVIPIVFTVASDPVASDFVASLARPDGNVTGLSLQTTDLSGKRIELLREVVPGLGRLAIMGNSGLPAPTLEMRELEATARALGIEVATSEIRRPEDIAPAFESASRIANIDPNDAMILPHNANPDRSNFRKGQRTNLVLGSDRTERRPIAIINRNYVPEATTVDLGYASRALLPSAALQFKRPSHAGLSAGLPTRRRCSHQPG